MPFVSVVVPFYNAKIFLPNLLDSLLNQTYPKEKYEILLVDDCSTDDSPKTVTEIIKKQTKNPNNIKLIRTDKRGGAAEARNIGIKNSKGEIIAFTDADAIPEAEWIQKLVQGFIDKIVGGVAGEITTDFERMLYPWRISPAGAAGFPTCNVAYRRNVLVECNLFDEGFRYPWREDADLGYRVLDKGFKIAQINDAVVYHPAKQNTIRSLLRYAKYFSEDVLLFKKHPLRSRSLLQVLVSRLTLNGLIVASNAVLFIALLMILNPLNALITFSLYSMFGSLIYSLIRPYTKCKNLRDKIVGLVAFEIYTLMIVVGHVMGSVRFKKLFL